MSKHTKGPWHHSKTHLWGCVTTKPDGCGSVILITPEGHAEDVTKANCAMASAAPHLLDACRLALALLDKERCPSTQNKECPPEHSALYYACEKRHEVRARYVAAIAKAEGRES